MRRFLATAAMAVAMLSGNPNGACANEESSPLEGSARRSTAAAFTFQGSLSQEGLPLSASRQMRAHLVTAAEGGNVLATANLGAVEVVNGLFSVQLDFGSGMFDGQPRWLRLEVYDPDEEEYVALSPATPVTAAPVAMFALDGNPGPKGDQGDPGPEGASPFTLNGSNAVFTGGNLGIGTNNPVTPLAIQSGSSPAGITQNQVGGAATMELTTQDGQGGQATRFLIRGQTDDVNYEFYAGKRGEERQLMQLVGNTGILRIGPTSNATAQLQIKAEDRAGATIETGNYVGASIETGNQVGAIIKTANKVGGIIESSHAQGAAIALRGTAPGATEWRMTSTGNSSAAGGGRLYFSRHAGGDPTDSLRLDADGTASVPVLEIRGGADIVEGFDASCGRELVPGTVVSIDPDSPGALMESRDAYDRKVAGIVSGAGGVNPGIKLVQEGVLDGDLKVAMAGRVHALATAENGPIQPGDLLTTSTVPGHAMRADDATRSHGAIIGKAMTSLENGTGLVLVLVNLQ